MSWEERAACRGVSTDIFFANWAGEALKYCARCPVIASCLAYAEKAENGNEPFGVYGGRTARQRKERQSQAANIRSSA